MPDVLFTPFGAGLLAIMVLLIAAAVLAWREKNLPCSGRTVAFFLFFAAPIELICATKSGYTFAHYLMIPSLSLLIALLFVVQKLKQKIRTPRLSKRLFLLFCTLACAFPLFFYVYSNIFPDKRFSRFLLNDANFTKMCGTHIPENEKTDFTAINTTASFYLSANLFSKSNYFVLQDWMGASDPKIIDEFMDFLENDSPKWVIYTEDPTYLPNQEIVDFLTENYEIVEQSEHGKLLKRQS
jgi:hypothetical protein